MKSLRKGVHNLYNNANVWSKIYHEFYHGIVYITIEGCHIIICKFPSSNDTMSVPCAGCKYCHVIMAGGGLVYGV